MEDKNDDVAAGVTVSWPNAFRPAREDLRHRGRVVRVTDTPSGRMIWVAGRLVAVPARCVRVEGNSE